MRHRQESPTGRSGRRVFTTWVALVLTVGGCADGVIDADGDSDRGGAGGNPGGAAGIATQSGGATGTANQSGGAGGGGATAIDGGAGGFSGAGGGVGGQGSQNQGGEVGAGGLGGAGGSGGFVLDPRAVPTIVAVGWNGWRVRSRDLGKTWQDEIKTVQIDGKYDKGTLFRGVTWGEGGGGLFVGVGDNIYTSPEGAKWTLRPSVDGKSPWGYLTDVAWGNGLFVAGGGYANVVVSADGVTWTHAGPVRGTGHYPGPAISSVEFGGGKFYVALDGKTYSSTDAKVWAEASGLPADRFCWKDGKLQPVANCRPYRAHGVYIRWQNPFLQWSLNGTTWTTGYTHTLAGPVLWSDTAEWLAIGYSVQ